VAPQSVLHTPDCWYVKSEDNPRLAQVARGEQRSGAQENWAARPMQNNAMRPSVTSVAPIALLRLPDLTARPLLRDDCTRQSGLLSFNRIVDRHCDKNEPTPSLLPTPRRTQWRHRSQ
jgi:hypothetical protein